MSSAGMPTVRLDSRMIRWEYRVARIPTVGTFGPDVDVDEIGDYLNGVGDDGWELVSLAPVQSGGSTQELIAVLKRQRQ